MYHDQLKNYASFASWVGDIRCSYFLLRLKTKIHETVASIFGSNRTLICLKIVSNVVVITSGFTLYVFLRYMLE